MREWEKLTKTAAERSKPRDEEYRIQDEIPGLSLRVRPSGSKAFILRYRTREGRLRLVTLGAYPDLSVTAARNEAHRLRGDVALGGDPVEDRKRARGGTFGELAERWVKEYARPHRKTWEEDKRRIDKHLEPALGSRPLPSITPDDLSDLHRKIGKRAKVEANRVVQLARTVFNWGQEKRVYPADKRNPAGDVKMYRERSRETWLKAEEVERLAKELRKVEDPYPRAALQLILLTGCRVTELLRARWERVDLDGRRLLLEDTKTGEAKTVPLSPPAASILEGLPRIEGNPWVFPSPKVKGQPLTTIRRTWEQVRTDAKIPHVTVHDLRRTVGSWLVQQGVPLRVVGAALGHRDTRSTEIYARIAAEQPREALDLLGSKLGSVLNGK